MSFSEQKAPTSIPHCMGATGSSPTMHLVLERMQSVRATVLPKSAFSWSQEPACGAGNVFSPVHLRSALPPSFSAAGISSVAIHGCWEGFGDRSLGGSSALESHQQVLTHLGRDHLPPHTSYRPWKWRCLPPETAAPATWRLFPVAPISQQASPSSGFQGAASALQPLCISLPPFPKGLGFEAFALLAVILSPTPKLSYGCHTVACSQHSLLPPGTFCSS